MSVNWKQWLAAVKKGLEWAGLLSPLTPYLGPIVAALGGALVTFWMMLWEVPGPFLVIAFLLVTAAVLWICNAVAERKDRKIRAKLTIYLVILATMVAAAVICRCLSVIRWGTRKSQLPAKSRPASGQLGPPLDPGMCAAERAFRNAGVETFESCQVFGGDDPGPTVKFRGDAAEGFRALSVASAAGLSVAELRRVWPILAGEATGPWWEITFAALPAPGL